MLLNQKINHHLHFVEYKTNYKTLDKSLEMLEIISDLGYYTIKSDESKTLTNLEVGLTSKDW